MHNIVNTSIPNMWLSSSLATHVQVNPDVLNLLLDYCRFHRAPGRSDKVRPVHRPLSTLMLSSRQSS